MAEKENDQVAELPAKRIRASILCPHCDQYLSKSSYYRHRFSFYNKLTKQWSKSKGYNKKFQSQVQSGDSDDDFGEEGSQPLPDAEESKGSYSIVASVLMKDSL